MNDPTTSYERPSLEVVSPLADLTRANTSGGFTDDAFPAGTPFGDLTFSN